MKNENSPAGNATDIDLAKLMDANPLAGAFKLALGTVALKDFDEATRIAEMAREALAATPQHSVTEQTIPKSNDGKEQDAFEAWANGERYDMTIHPMHWLFLNERTYAARQGWKAALEYVSSVCTQPLASTAATQPEQASADKLRAALVSLLNRYVELVASGDAGNWDAETEDEVIAARAALAIPASTVPTQQENEQANVLPPFAAPASQHDASELVQANEVMRKALEDIAQPANAGCGCSFPCRCNDDGAEVINAGVMRDIASDTLAELDRRFRAQGGSTNTDSIPASTAASEHGNLLDELQDAIGGWGGDFVEKIEAIIEKHRAHPDCGACPGNGSLCATECRLRADSPAAASEQQASVSGINGTPFENYAIEDQAFFTFWYSHMKDEVMQPPLSETWHSTARYIWDAALAQQGAAQAQAGALYTCIGKGGAYELIGTAHGAGFSRGVLAIIYREVATGVMYHRTPDDFGKRMERAAMAAPATSKPARAVFVGDSFLEGPATGTGSDA